MTRIIVASSPNPHLPHDSAELQSPPPKDARTAEQARANAERIVARLMQEMAAQPLVLSPDMRRPAPDREPNPVPPASARAVPAAEEGAAAPRKAPPGAEHGDVAALADGCAHPAGAKRAAAATGGDDHETIEARVRAALLAEVADADAPSGDAAADAPARRPVWRRAGLMAVVALVALAAAMAIWPVATGLVLLLLVWGALAGGMALRAVVADGRWPRFAARHPRQAEALRRVADPLAERFDRVLDLLPESWAEALALPDLSLPSGPGAPMR